MVDQKLREWIISSKEWTISRSLNNIINFNGADNPIDRYHDFYIGLLYNLNALLRKCLKDNVDTSEYKKYLLEIAKGLEMYSLEVTRDKFCGVNVNNNLIVIAALYYLGDYSSNAKVILKLIDRQYSNTSKINDFIYFFLTDNKVGKHNNYITLLDSFYKKQKKEIIDQIILNLNNDCVIAIAQFPHDIIFYRLSILLMKKFQSENIFLDLLKVDNEKDIWLKYLEVNRNIRVLFPAQRKALKANLLTSSETFSLKMPTSAGKTTLIELLVYYEVRKKRNKVLFLVPFRSLASELKLGFCEKLKKMGVTTKTAYASSKTNGEELDGLQQIDCLVATPEKFQTLCKLRPSILDLFSVVVCDEGHIIDDSSRGILYEQLLCKLKESTSHLRFIYISAVIPNIDIVHKWLNGNAKTLIECDFQPVNILHGKLKKNADSCDLIIKLGKKTTTISNFISDDFTDKKIIVDGKESALLKVEERTDKFKTDGTYEIFNSDDLSVLTALKLLELKHGAIMIFCPEKNCIEKLCENFCRIIDSNHLISPIDLTDSIDINPLLEYLMFKVGESSLIYKCASRGFVFHHGDMPQEIREFVEKAIVNKHVQLIISNKTLSEGVNLPIKTLIVTSDKIGLKKLLNRDLVNLFGRVGRAGKEVSGMIVKLPGVRENQEVEPVQGKIKTLLNNINKFVIEKSIQLDIETLNKIFTAGTLLEGVESEKDFKKFRGDNLSLYDQFDRFLINSLLEECDDLVFDSELENICNNTFSLIDSSESIKAIFKILINCKISNLRKNLSTGEMQIFKKSGMSLCDYVIVKNEFEKFDFKLDSVFNYDWTKLFVETSIKILDLKKR